MKTALDALATMTVFLPESSESLSSSFKFPPSCSETWRLYTQWWAVYLYKLCVQLMCDFVKLWGFGFNLVPFTRHFRRLKILTPIMVVNNKGSSTRCDIACAPTCVGWNTCFETTLKKLQEIHCTVFKILISWLGRNCFVREVVENRFRFNLVDTRQSFSLSKYLKIQ
jgi:hypothetical protein